MKIPFSPPDITEAEANEVRDALLSGWITTGPRTKELERQIATFCQTKRAVCLNSATACLESILRILGIGPGDEVITSAYTYTASASVGSLGLYYFKNALVVAWYTAQVNRYDGFGAFGDSISQLGIIHFITVLLGIYEYKFGSYMAYKAS